jgi:hypothetical protein
MALVVLHNKDEEETQIEDRQLPNRIPAKQSEGTHAVCSQIGFIEDSRAFKEESENPKDEPDTVTNELPVVGILLPHGRAVVSTESQVITPLKIEYRLDTDIAIEISVP